MRIISILTVFLLGLAVGVHAQVGPPIIINELHNEGSQADEWTELIVVQDNLDLRGWYIGDNNAATNSWQPKLKFSNDPLWNHLRRGTYIILEHAANVNECRSVSLQDVDKSDGFISVCVRNTTMFDGGTATTMFLASDGDFVQLVDPSGNHKFGLGFDPSPGGSVEGTCRTNSANWTNITTAKANTPPCGPFIFMEQKLNDGNSFGHTDSTLTIFNSNPGLHLPDSTDPRFKVVPPTQGHGNNGLNKQLLINLRKPDWTSQIGCIVPINSGNKLSWTAVPDLNPSDQAVKYLILRSVTGSFPTPEQGRQYANNAVLGTAPAQATVLEMGLTLSTINTFTDFNPPANASYRVYAYRYVRGPGVVDEDRGPAYNLSNFADFVTTIVPPYTVNAPRLACDGDTIQIALVHTPFGRNVTWSFDTTSGAHVTILRNDSVAQVVVHGQNPMRDSVKARIDLISVGPCDQSLTIKAAVAVRNRPVVTVTAVDSLVARNTQAQFVVTTQAGTTSTSMPPVTFTPPSANVGFTFLGGDTTLTVTSFYQDLPGCSTTASATVKEAAPPDSVFYNNILTNNPNSKANYYFTINGGTVQKIAIHNRWGKQVLKGSSYDNSWHGNPGNYFFTATMLVKDPSVPIFGFRQVTLKGWIEVQ